MVLLEVSLWFCWRFLYSSAGRFLYGSAGGFFMVLLGGFSMSNLLASGSVNCTLICCLFV